MPHTSKLTQYRQKRDFAHSPEPRPTVRKKKQDGPVFVIQEHHARRLHYDLRLELKGVLKSWAVTKQPTMDPSIKRLAIMVEDHPYDYKDFEGVIPSGYGAGTVHIWDRGTYAVEGGEKAIQAGLKKGHLQFALQGKKLQGTFHLVRMKENQWLLIKKREQASSPALTNLDKVYWPKEGITKGDLLRYYSAVAKWILPYLKDRPESLRRYPDGIAGEVFFQKNLEQHPDWIETVPIEHAKKTVHYLLIQSEESLLFAANLGCIEIHPFFSRIQKLPYPDFLIFDLDPKQASFEKVIQVAREIRKVLDEIEVPSVCKTSGASGLHVAVPLGAKYTYEEAKKFALIVATLVQKRIPQIVTLERSIAKRAGKVYIDCLQNNLGQTLAAPYSVRAKPKAPVSTPLKWSEVKKGLSPTDFTIKNILKRLKKVGDLYKPILGKGINLKAALKNIGLIHKLYMQDKKP